MRGFIFDFNGTLFYDSPMHNEVFKRICGDYGIPEYSDEYILKNIFGRANRDILLNNYNKDASEDEIAYFNEYKEERYRELCLEKKEDLHLAYGAPEFLDYLKLNGIPYCIATSSPRANMDFYFKYLDLARWFSYDENVIYDDGTLVCKPAPDVYLRAATKLGIVPEDCIVFEDSKVGIIAANNAGIKDVFALVREGDMSPSDSSMFVAGEIPDFTGYMEIIDRFI